MRIFLLALLFLGAPSVLAAPVGTAFTYQGELQLEGANANGNFDFQFQLYDSLELGSPVGSIVQVDNVPVADGIFTVQLDFGSEPFDGNALYLQISVRENTEPYTELSPRQELTPVPYAIHAAGGVGAPNDTVWRLGGSMLVSADNQGRQRIDLLQVPYPVDLRMMSLTISPLATTETPPTPHETGIRVHLLHADELEPSGLCPTVSGGAVPGLFGNPLGTSVTLHGQFINVPLNEVLTPNWDYLTVLAQSPISPFAEPIEEYTTCLYYETAGPIGDRHEFEVHFSVDDHGTGFSLADYWVGLFTP